MDPGVPGNGDDSSWIAVTKQFARYAHVGMMFPVSIALGFFGGYYLDQWLGTSPLFALVGTGIGVAAAVRNLFRTVGSGPMRTGDDG